MFVVSSRELNSLRGVVASRFVFYCIVWAWSLGAMLQRRGDLEAMHEEGELGSLSLNEVTSRLSVRPSGLQVARFCVAG